MSRDESIYEGFCEIVAFTKLTVEVEVEDGKDDLGSFVKVRYNNLLSSKYYYDK